MCKNRIFRQHLIPIDKRYFFTSFSNGWRLSMLKGLCWLYTWWNALIIFKSIKDEIHVKVRGLVYSGCKFFRLDFLLIFNRVTLQTINCITQRQGKIFKFWHQRLRKSARIARPSSSFFGFVHVIRVWYEKMQYGNRNQNLELISDW